MSILEYTVEKKEELDNFESFVDKIAALNVADWAICKIKLPSDFKFNYQGLDNYKIPEYEYNKIQHSSFSKVQSASSTRTKAKAATSKEGVYSLKWWKGQSCVDSTIGELREDLIRMNNSDDLLSSIVGPSDEETLRLNKQGMFLSYSY